MAVNTDARPVKQVLRKQSKEKLEFISSETDKLLEVGFIKVVPHPTWVANPVVVPKPNSSKLRLCVDFTDLNTLSSSLPTLVPVSYSSSCSCAASAW